MPSQRNQKLPERLRELLDPAKRPLGHVCTLRSDGQLSVHPVAVVLDGEELWFSTTKDRRKYENLRRDPRIAQLYMNQPHYDLDPPDAERVVVVIRAEQISAPGIPKVAAPPPRGG